MKNGRKPVERGSGKKVLYFGVLVVKNETRFLAPLIRFQMFVACEVLNAQSTWDFLKDKAH